MAIKSAILMQRNGFVKADFFFTLPEVRMGVLFFHRNRYFGGGFTELKYLSANCQLFKQYQVKPVMVRLFLLLITCYPCFPTQRRRICSIFKFTKNSFLYQDLICKCYLMSIFPYTIVTSFLCEIANLN